VHSKEQKKIQINSLSSTSTLTYVTFMVFFLYSSLDRSRLWPSRSRLGNKTIPKITP
jgi:hypothetical protein